MALFQFDWPWRLATNLDAELAPVGAVHNARAQRGFEVWCAGEIHLRRLITAGTDPEIAAFAFVRLCEIANDDLLGPRLQRRTATKAPSRGDYRAVQTESAPRRNQQMRRPVGRQAPKEARSIVSGVSRHCYIRTGYPQHMALADLLATVWPPLRIVTAPAEKPKQRWNQLRDVIRNYRKGSDGRHDLVALTDALHLAPGQPI